MRVIANVLAAALLLLGLPLRAQVLEWARCYDGPGDYHDRALAVAVDSLGHVYVSGGSELFGGGEAAYATIKYDASGDTLWVRRFDVSGGGSSLALDDAGNVYVTGVPVTLKYSPDGALRWTHDHGALFRALALGPDGNVVAAGNDGFDIRVTKLDPDGGVIFEAAFDGPARLDDRGHDLALDSRGNALVVGASWGLVSKGDGTQWNYTTLKYDPEGALLWARHYNGPAAPLDVPTDIAWAVAVDEADNVYVTGWSDGVTNPAECLTIKYDPEGETLWERRFTGGGACYDLLYDGGYLYAAARGGGGDRLLKYDPDGELVWARLYATEIGFATNPPRLAADADGNVYATSVTFRSDYVVLKYTPAGVREWAYVYPGTGDNTSSLAYGLAVDAEANVYVTGENTYGGTCGGHDYLTLKLSQVPVGVEDPGGAPPGNALHPPRPNPSRGTAVIGYAVGAPADVSLQVYDALGRLVTTLAEGAHAGGLYEVALAGSGLPGGVYFLRLEVGGAAGRGVPFVQTRRLVLLR